MLISGSCAVVYGPLAAAGVSQPVMVVLALVWGGFTIAESAQFSAIVSETCDQSAVGTALTLQLAMGYISTVSQRLFNNLSHSFTMYYNNWRMLVVPCIATNSHRDLALQHVISSCSSDCIRCQPSLETVYLTCM
jgi:hypothetical protein